jgi:hypothetical protein
MIVSHLAVIFPVFQETQMIITFIARAHYWNLYLADFLNISSDISRLQLSIFPAFRHEYSRYLSEEPLWIFCFFFFLSRILRRIFSTCHPTVNIPESLSDASRWIISVFFLGDSRWIISMFFWATHGELSPCSFGRLTVNYLPVFLGDSRWTITMYCWATHGELSPCFVGRLTVNYLHVLLGDSRWFSSEVITVGITRSQVADGGTTSRYGG